jgi:EAL domain-containing protein (putative c-di-GMP-specific phosphodiesterase class I)
MVYISVSADHLEKKLQHALSVLKYHFKDTSTYFMVETPNFEVLITELIDTEFFNSIEQNEIHILPVELGQFLDFSLFSQTHTLAYWSSLLQHKDLLYVLEHQRLVTMFQPIVFAENLDCFGYEGLSRGLLTDGRYLSPHTMFSAAKQLGLLSYLDRLCRESGIRHAAKQNIKNHLFLNFIPTAIYDPEACLETTINAISDSNLQVNQVVFEVVETEAVEDYAHLKQILDFYRAQGYETALDDIGSGFSTIESFHSLDTKFVKIDMDIVRNIHHNVANQNFFHRIMNLKQDYGVTIIAEGIERDEEYQYLKMHGVDLMQGYYFGKPELNIL